MQKFSIRCVLTVEKRLHALTFAPCSCYSIANEVDS